ENRSTEGGVAQASDIYQQAIKALAAEADGDGTLEAPSGRAFVDNPLCGDCIEMQVVLADGHIRALAHKVRGCLLCRAAAAVIGKRAIGAQRAQIERVAEELAAMLRAGS